MSKKILLFLLFSLVIVFLPSQQARAGFGVSPPYVFSDKILPGTRYEQTITLLRSDANNALYARVIIKAPQIVDWISIDKGFDFELPVGETRIPLVIYIDVPENAPIGKYEGEIDINVSEKNPQSTSGLELAVGAQINLNIGLTRDIYRDFSVKRAEIADLELPKKPWQLSIFSRIFRRLRLSLNIENNGNIAVAPSKVSIDIYDISQEKLLESATAERLNKIPPFQTKDIKAVFPLKIGAGQYWASVKTYNGKDIISSDKIAFTILPSGVFKRADIYPWAFVFTILIFFWLIITFVLKIKISKIVIKLFKTVYLMSNKLLQSSKQIIIKIKTKFWQWVYDKILKNKN